MAGTRTAPVNTTPNYFAADVQQDTNTFLANDAAILQAVFGGWNILVSGCALSAGAGMVVNVAAGQVVVNGVVLNIAAGPVTLATGGAQPRYDLIYAQLNPTGPLAGTNPSGQPNQTDTYALGVQTGVGASGPTKGTLPGISYVQVGSVYVPAGVATAAACVLNNGDTLPNAQGYRSLVDLLVHIAANATNVATVHGIQQGAGHGFDADTVDTLHASAFDAAGTASGQVAAEAATRAAADTTEATARVGVQTNLTAHQNQSVYAAITHGQESRRGHATGISITGGMGQVQVATITFSPAMAGTPQCITLTMDQPNPGGAPPYAVGASAAGFQIWMSTAGTYNGGIYWRADS